MLPFDLRIFAFLTVILLAAAQVCTAANGIKVHEWGTFTSIAGPDGSARPWQPLGGKNDLPCFINRFENNTSLKSELLGTVRMETPVLYFYTPSELTITAQVRFPLGLITEWYPRAEITPMHIDTSNGPIYLQNGAITWRDVSVSPHAAPEFADDASSSHYYAARAVEAAALRIGEEQERFLFYRGVGNFAPPVSARTTERGTLLLQNLTDDPIDGIILFERHGPQMGYRIGDRLEARAGRVIELPILTSNATDPRDDVERLLTDHGLYPAEAKAMLRTWQKAWFEEGARLLYLTPRPVIDAVLPLTITPSADELARVFMGRLEIITPGSLIAVESAIAEDDLVTLTRYDRFALPIIERVLAGGGHGVDAVRLDRLLAAVYASNAAEVSSCP
jgi:hypothetical protein